MASFAELAIGRRAGPVRLPTRKLKEYAMPLRTAHKLHSRKTKSSTFSLLILAGGCAIAGFLLAQTQSKVEAAVPAPAPLIVAEFNTVPVPVPLEYVPVGTAVRKIKFITVEYPKHQLPPQAILDASSVSDAVTIAPLPARLPLFRENLSFTAHASNPVIERIPQGMRAMTLRVDATSAVEGWAGSGAVIDVLLIEKEQTTVVAEKVKILSAERSVAPVEGAASPSVPSTVTLLVTQEQCLAINTAIPLGKIAFALRSLGDDHTWSDTRYTAERLKRARGGETRAHLVNGYVQVENGSEAYVLADGKWLPSEVIPQGFLLGEKTAMK